MEKEITNRVEKSGIVQIDLDDLYPTGERKIFDMKELLFQEQILLEKDIRSFVKQHDWSIYKNNYVSILCSVDAIIPLWAFMLIASHIKPHSKKVIFGTAKDMEKSIFSDIISTYDFSIFKDKSVIIKGCGKYPIPESVIIDFSMHIQEFAKSIIFGEACSAVPIYKR